MLKGWCERRLVGERVCGSGRGWCGSGGSVGKERWCREGGCGSGGSVGEEGWCGERGWRGWDGIMSSKGQDDKLQEEMIE